MHLLTQYCSILFQKVLKRNQIWQPDQNFPSVYNWSIIYLCLQPQRQEGDHTIIHWSKREIDFSHKLCWCWGETGFRVTDKFLPAFLALPGALKQLIESSETWGADKWHSRWRLIQVASEWTPCITTASSSILAKVKFLVAKTAFFLPLKPHKHYSEQQTLFCNFKSLPKSLWNFYAPNPDCV